MTPEAVAAAMEWSKATMKNTIPTTLRVSCVILGFCAALAGSVRADTILYANDFSSGGGAFTVANSGSPAPENPWTYNAGAGGWRANGSENLGNPSYSALISPPITVTASGKPITLSFDHRYSFEYDGTRWDGGQVKLSVNGGAFNLVPGSSFTQNSYTGILNPGTSGSVTPPWNGQEGYNADSAGYASGQFITSIADLGSFNTGDQLQVEFYGGWDWFSRGSVPNWEITGVQVSQVPEPSQVAMGGLTLVLGGVVAFRQWRRGR